jgi:hypothetical protein
MHPEIENLINMALADGLVTEKEREIILRKADKLALDLDEVEMYLEGKISTKNTDFGPLDTNIDYEFEKEQPKESKIINDLKLEISESYIDKNDLKKVIENISKFENKIIEVDEYYSQNFNNWVNEEFLKLIQEHPKKIRLDELNSLINASSFFAGKKYKEGRIANFLNRIIDNEGFVGYFVLDYKLIPLNRITNNNEYSDNYLRLLFTKKSVYFFNNNIYDIINKRFICSRVEYKSMKNPEIYTLDIYNCSTDNIIYKLEFDSTDYRSHEIIMENNGIEFTDDCYKLDFLHNNTANACFNFFHLFSLVKLDKISFDDLIKNFKTEINNDKIKSILQKSNLNVNQISNIQKINNYIQNFLADFNLLINNKKENIYYYDYLTQENSHSFTIEDYNNKLGSSGCKPSFNNHLEKIINYYKFTMTHMIVILDLRDKLLNFYLTNNFVEANETMLKLDNYGVFLTKFERTSIENLEEINKSLNKLNNTLIEGFSMITSAIESLGNNLENIKDSIDKIDSTLDIGNFIQIIQSYQLYKINKNTKS